MERTRHMNPLKAHVYLSWGVPVVSTAVATVDADGELVRMAVSHGVFLDQVETTLAAPPPAPGRFRYYVGANAWRARLDRQVDRTGFDRVGQTSGNARGHPGHHRQGTVLSEMETSEAPP